jgi:hypothetical protein
MITGVARPTLRIKTMQHIRIIQYVYHTILCFCIVFTTGCAQAEDLSIDSWSTSKPLQRLRVSSNGRFLVAEDGEPFFWLGDTAWRMIQKATLTDREQPSVAHYFAARRSQGFNVVQTVAAHDGNVINSAGHAAFEDGDFTRPRVVSGPVNDYWDQCDAILDLAEEHGFYVALLPLWINSIGGRDPIVQNPSIAYQYGHFLGDRFGNRANLIWVLGGDPSYRKGRDVDQPERLALVRAMAEGIDDGTGAIDHFDGKADWSTTLMTYHPKGGGHSSSEYLHAEPWLDVNMIQTTTRFHFTNYETVAIDYAKKPPKPTLDAEVAYEDSLSLSKKEPRDRRTGAWEARRAAYWSVFAGGFGHTYGHRSLILWTLSGEHNKHGADTPWFLSLETPGAIQMGYLRQLMESLAFLSRIPDQSIIDGDPGHGIDHAQATRDAEGRYVLVYLPTGRRVAIHMDKVRGSKANAWWFNPRDASRKPIGAFDTRGSRRFKPPTHGEGQDWVLMVVSENLHGRLENAE